MPKTAPSAGRLATMALFALSCFGLLTFLWLSFGGAVPLKPQGYRVEVPFTEATQLALQADVRISGVPVGKVVALERDGRFTVAELELESEYAPIGVDAKARLRSKTLLGETFVQLVPGSRGARRLREGERLASTGVVDTVQIDEVLADLDKPTRTSLQAWLQGWSRSVEGRASSISNVTGTLPELARNGLGVTGTLDRQARAVSRLVRDGGTVLETVGDRDSAVQELVTGGATLLEATAARDRALRATVRELPGFLGSLRGALPPLTRVADELTPVLRELRPTVRRLPSTLDDATAFAPALQRSSRALDAVLPKAETGLPAIRRVLDAVRPAAKELAPLGAQLEPVVSFLEIGRNELTYSWPKVAAATQASAPNPKNGDPLHYLRLVPPFWSEVLALNRTRQPTNRTNAYLEPRGLGKIAENRLEAIDCSNTRNPAGLPPLLLGGTAPPCLQQQPFPFGDARTQYPRLDEDVRP